MSILPNRGDDKAGRYLISGSCRSKPRDFDEFECSYVGLGEAAYNCCAAATKDRSHLGTVCCEAVWHWAARSYVRIARVTSERQDQNSNQEVTYQTSGWYSWCRRWPISVIAEQIDTHSIRIPPPSDCSSIAGLHGLGLHRRQRYI